MKIVRTKGQAEKLKNLIQVDLENLPEFNAFGDSNSEDAKELVLQIQELDEFIKKGVVPKDTCSEIYAWLTSENAFMDAIYGDLIK